MSSIQILTTPYMGTDYGAQSVSVGFMGHRMSIGLLPGTQLLFLVLLFRLALSDAQTIQQGIFIDKQFYCIPKNKSDNRIFYTGN